jgi:hypothetical protein
MCVETPLPTFDAPTVLRTQVQPTEYMIHEQAVRDSEPVAFGSGGHHGSRSLAMQTAIDVSGQGGCVGITKQREELLTNRRKGRP